VQSVELGVGGLRVLRRRAGDGQKRAGAISVQVLQEFYINATRKARKRHLIVRSAATITP
jgi:hypothetical protein